jgi:heme exporter protein D
MHIEFLTLGEYSQYVWPAFIFSFTICFSFYVKTQKKLKKLEIIFENEFKVNKNIGSSQQKDKVRAEALASFAN